MLSTLKQFILCVINILSDIMLLIVEHSRWPRFRILRLFVKVTPAICRKFQDRGSKGENLYQFQIRKVKMWGRSKTRTLDKAKEIYIFTKSIFVSFWYFSLFIYVSFCCNCWHSADEWCHIMWHHETGLSRNFYFGE